MYLIFLTVSFDLLILCSKAVFSFSNKIYDSFLWLKSILFLSSKEAICARASNNSCFMRRASQGDATGAKNKTYSIRMILHLLFDVYHQAYYS